MQLNNTAPINSSNPLMQQQQPPSADNNNNNAMMMSGTSNPSSAALFQAVNSQQQQPSQQHSQQLGPIPTLLPMMYGNPQQQQMMMQQQQQMQMQQQQQQMMMGGQYPQQQTNNQQQQQQQLPTKVGTYPSAAPAGSPMADNNGCCPGEGCCCCDPREQCCGGPSQPPAPGDGCCGSCGGANSCCGPGGCLDCCNMFGPPQQQMGGMNGQQQHYQQQQTDCCGCGCGGPNGGCCGFCVKPPNYVYTDKAMPPTCCDNTVLGIFIMFVLGVVGVVLVCVLPGNNDQLWKADGLGISGAANVNEANLALCNDYTNLFAADFIPRQCSAVLPAPIPAMLRTKCTKIDGIGFLAAATLDTCAEDIFTIQFVQSQISFYRNYSAAIFIILALLMLVGLFWAVYYNNNAWAIVELIKYGRIVPPQAAPQGSCCGGGGVFDSCCGPNGCCSGGQPQYPQQQQQGMMNNNGNGGYYNNNGQQQQQMNGAAGGDCCGCGNCCGPTQPGQPDNGCLSCLPCCSNGPNSCCGNSQQQQQQPDYTQFLPILLDGTAHFSFLMGVWRVTGLVIAFSSIAVLYPLLQITPAWKDYSNGPLKDFFSALETKYVVAIIVCDALLLLPFLWDYVIKPLLWVLGVGPWVVYRSWCDTRVTQRPRGYRTAEEMRAHELEALSKVTAYMTTGKEAFDNNASDKKSTINGGGVPVIVTGGLLAGPSTPQTMGGGVAGGNVTTPRQQHNADGLLSPQPTLPILVDHHHHRNEANEAATASAKAPVDHTLLASTYMRYPPRVFGAGGAAMGTAHDKLARPYAVQQHQLATMQLLAGWRDGGAVNASAAVTDMALQIEERAILLQQQQQKGLSEKVAEGTMGIGAQPPGTPRASSKKKGDDKKNGGGEGSSEASKQQNNNDADYDADGAASPPQSSSKFIQDALLFHQNTLYNDPNGADPADIYKNLSCWQQLDAFFVDDRSIICGGLQSRQQSQYIARLMLQQEINAQQEEIRRLREISERQEEMIRTGTSHKKEKSKKKDKKEKHSSRSSRRGGDNDNGDGDGVSDAESGVSTERRDKSSSRRDKSKEKKEKSRDKKEKSKDKREKKEKSRDKSSRHGSTAVTPTHSPITGTTPRQAEEWSVRSGATTPRNVADETTAAVPMTPNRDPPTASAADGTNHPLPLPPATVVPAAAAAATAVSAANSTSSSLHANLVTDDAPSDSEAMGGGAFALNTIVSHSPSPIKKPQFVGGEEVFTDAEGAAAKGQRKEKKDKSKDKKEKHSSSSRRSSRDSSRERRGDHDRSPSASKEKRKDKKDKSHSSKDKHDKHDKDKREKSAKKDKSHKHSSRNASRERSPSTAFIQPPSGM